MPHLKILAAACPTPVYAVELVPELATACSTFQRQRIHHAALQWTHMQRLTLFAPLHTTCLGTALAGVQRAGCQCSRLFLLLPESMAGDAPSDHACSHVGYVYGQKVLACIVSLMVCMPTHSYLQEPGMHSTWHASTGEVHVYA